MAVFNPQTLWALLVSNGTNGGAASITRMYKFYAKTSPISGSDFYFNILKGPRTKNFIRNFYIR